MAEDVFAGVEILGDEVYVHPNMHLYQDGRIVCQKRRDISPKLPGRYILAKGKPIHSIQCVMFSLLRRTSSFQAQIGQIVDLYERETTYFFNGLSPIAR